MLLMALPNEHLLTFSQYKDAKTLFESIQARFGRNDATNKTQKTLLKQMYENFNAPSTESLDSIFNMLQKIVSQLAILGENISQEDLNMKFLRSLPAKWNTLVLALLSMRARMYFQRNGKKITIIGSDTAGYEKTKTVIMEDTSSKVMVAINGAGFDWCYMANDEVLTNMALMAFSDSEFNKSEFDLATYKRGLASVEEQLVFYKKNEVMFCDQIIVLKRDASFKDSEINALNLQLEKLKKEKESNHIKIDNFKNASKSLDKLIGSQITDNSKTGLGFASYNVVAPPLTGLFAPPTADLSNSGLEEFKQPEFEEYGPKASEPISAARPISTVVPKPTVNVAKTRSNAFQKSHSLSRRTFYQQTTLKNRNLINTAKVNSINTVKVNRVTSAVEKQGINAVKFSTCWVWRPKIKGDPQDALKDTRIFDSVCSRHITGNKSYLTNYQEYDRGFVAFACISKRGKITGKGKIKTGKLDFEDVYFVKELKFNLFSVSQMCDKKNSVLFTKTECLILSPDFKLPDESQEAWSYKFKTLNKLLKGNLVRGLPSKIFENDHTCVAYQKGKQHKASSERKNRTLIEEARTILADSPLPILFWAEAVNTACYVQNRVLVTKPHNKTPYELLIGRPPIISFMRPFGCPVTILNTLDHLGKFNGKADEGFLVGYFINSKDFRVYNSRTRKTVNAGNRTNGNAGSEINFDAGQAGKEKEDESLPKYDADKKSIAEPTCVEGGKSDDLESLDQQIKNGTFQRTIGEWDFSIPITVNVASSSFSPPSPLDDFSKMPNLEDIGIFDDAYDDRDEGAEADYNNLETMEPKKVTQALDDERWVESMQEEHLQFKLLNVWTLVHLTHRKRAIRAKWVYRNKSDQRGIVVRNKARLSAFLYGTIEEEVYVSQPSGFVDLEFPDIVYNVEKALYGLHQAPRAWYETLSTYLLDNRSKRGTIDKTLFIKKIKNDILLVQVYVDDIIFGSTKRSLSTEFEQLMHNRFQMSSIEELTFFLGLKVEWRKDDIFLNQDKFVCDILKKFGYSSVKSASTPMVTHKPLSKDADGTDVDVHLYRSMIGSLMYLTSSWPDIMFAVCACSRFQVQPKVPHMHAVKRIVKYLKGQPTVGLWYPKDSPLELIAYSDSDYAGLELKGYLINDGYADLVQHADKKELAIPGQTTTGKEFSNQLMSDNNTEFHQIVDFLSLCAITYALTVSPTIYASYIEQFWNTVSSKAINFVKQIHAIVDGKAVVISESSVRSDLLFDDEDGITCLTNDEIFENFALMGYKPLPTKLTFQKCSFFPQWKFLIHTILYCISSKSTGWNEFSTNLALAVICLVKCQKFNFSKLIFDDEAVHQEEGDSVEIAITTDAILEAAHASDNILKTQTTIMPNVDIPQGMLEQPSEPPLQEDEEEPSVDIEDSPKQGRMIEELDKDEDVNLVSEQKEVQETAEPLKDDDDATLTEKFC
uniref:Retrovirus-related Pol polyprotein from transposon TNT 1-94 n=1 Tax=Tanacetum cinerariifolium TaxID=118510 RepID=A0A699H3I4_TANCI|nr:retrovirus-related Pol polyprotein from transposon TNT 1-94 [Tanacetum cinerariifolium]